MKCNHQTPDSVFTPAFGTLPTGRIPDKDGIVIAAGDDKLSIGAEDDAGQSIGMPAQDVQLAPAVDIPQAGRVVQAAAHEGVTIGAEGERADVIVVTAQHAAA